MKDKFDIEFCYKGERDYVHGSDIFNRLIEITLNSGVKNAAIDFSIHGISRANLTFFTAKPLNIKTVKTALAVKENNGSSFHLFGVENDKPIDCRYAYPEEKIVEKINRNSNEGEAELLEETSYTFIENLLVLNKFLVLKMFPHLKGKWYFTKLQLNKIILNDFLPLRVVFRNNFNYKFTKTEIFIGTKSAGFIYFSIV